MDYAPLGADGQKEEKNGRRMEGGKGVREVMNRRRRAYVKIFVLPLI